MQALTFDAFGYLWLAGMLRSTATQADYEFGIGTYDVAVNVYNNASIDDSRFEFFGQLRFDGARAGMSAGVIGSAGEDYITGIQVISSALGRGRSRATVAASRLFLSGYTVGAAGAPFNFTSPDITITPVPGDVVLPAPATTSAWYAVMDGYLKGTGTGVWARFINSGSSLLAQTGSMSYDAASGAAFVSGSMKGTGALAVAGVATPIVTFSSSWDAFMLRITTAGNVVFSRI